MKHYIIILMLPAMLLAACTEKPEPIREYLIFLSNATDKDVHVQYYGGGLDAKEFDVAANDSVLIDRGNDGYHGMFPPETAFDHDSFIVSFNDRAIVVYGFLLFENIDSALRPIMRRYEEYYKVPCDDAIKNIISFKIDDYLYQNGKIVESCVK
ncbi:MAG: hypothetical protein IJU72_00015 [Bacteroidales bacterium]|nr:hypothetical protein [Bacteroidales bacterium]